MRIRILLVACGGFLTVFPTPVPAETTPEEVPRLQAREMELRQATPEPSSKSAPAAAPKPAPAAKKPAGPERWEAEVAKIEARLKADPPAPGGVAFAGSSSIRLWDLKQSFPGLPLTNCGFGGSMIPDSTHFATRLLLPLKPRLIVFYAGDNDSSNGRSAERIADDFTAFAAVIHAALPECRILYIPIKPSISRQKLWPRQQQANALIEKLCAAQPGQLQYLDLATPLFAADGSLRPEVYKKDGLHLSPAGYAIWNRLLRPHLGPADANGQ